MAKSSKQLDNEDRRKTLETAVDSDQKKKAKSYYQKQADMLINGGSGTGEGAVYYEGAAKREKDPARKKQFEQIASEKRADAKKWLDKGN